MSRAEAARRSGLSKPTVSQALLGLEDAGLVHQAGRSRGPKGPGAVVYELNPESGWVVGIDVGSHWVRAALADITGTVRARRDERTHRSAAATVAQIRGLADGLAGERGLDWSRITHATVGLPGVLDPSGTRLALSPNLPGGKHGLVEAIRTELGGNVSFENDVNLAALGESARGVGQGVSNFVFLWVGTGIGLGIVVDGQLYRGAAGAAGEIAYLPVGPGDPHDPAYRRRGQLEETAAAAAVTRIAREHGLRSPSAKNVFAAARRGDPAAAAVVEADRGPDRARDRRGGAGARSRARDPGRRHRRQWRGPAVRADRAGASPALAVSATAGGLGAGRRGRPARRRCDRARGGAGDVVRPRSRHTTEGGCGMRGRRQLFGAARCAGAGAGRRLRRERVERVELRRELRLAHAGHAHRLAPVRRRGGKAIRRCARGVQQAVPVDPPQPRPPAQPHQRHVRPQPDRGHQGRERAGRRHRLHARLRRPVLLERALGRPDPVHAEGPHLDRPVRTRRRSATPTSAASSARCRR